jgi:methyl-accepting chemotaxis protein
VWAGDVCVARDGLTAAVGALGRNLSYDITSDRSALEQIDRQLRIQVLAVADNADRLGQALKGVPVDFRAANDLVVSATKAKDDTTQAVGQVTTSLDAMVNADNVIAGVAEAGKALVAAKAAFAAGGALISTISDATSTASGELGDAFAAAPQCQGAGS